jgi:hypothetical protein
MVILLLARDGAASSAKADKANAPIINVIAAITQINLFITFVPFITRPSFSFILFCKAGRVNRETGDGSLSPNEIKQQRDYYAAVFAEKRRQGTVNCYPSRRQ